MKRVTDYRSAMYLVYEWRGSVVRGKPIDLSGSRVDRDLFTC